jgi:hypothetical protein
VAFGGGYAIAAFGYHALFLAGAFLTAAGVLLFWVYFLPPQGDYALPPLPVAATEVAESPSA